MNLQWNYSVCSMKPLERFHKPCWYGHCCCSSSCGVCDRVSITINITLESMLHVFSLSAWQCGYFVVVTHFVKLNLIKIQKLVSWFKWTHIDLPQQQSVSKTADKFLKTEKWSNWKDNCSIRTAVVPKSEWLQFLNTTSWLSYVNDYQRFISKLK